MTSDGHEATMQPRTSSIMLIVLLLPPLSCSAWHQEGRRKVSVDDAVDRTVVHTQSNHSLFLSFTTPRSPHRCCCISLLCLEGRLLARHFPSFLFCASKKSSYSFTLMIEGAAENMDTYSRCSSRAGLQRHAPEYSQGPCLRLPLLKCLLALRGHAFGLFALASFYPHTCVLLSLLLSCCFTHIFLLTLLKLNRCCCSC